MKSSNIHFDAFDKAAKVIALYSLIEKGDAVLVGLSGGPDSVALLHILYRLQHQFGFNLGAVYINHRLRPRIAKKEANFCADLCSRLSLPFLYDEVDIPHLAKMERRGIEETARKYRYQALVDLAQQDGYQKIAVGHHQDDRAETILFNLFRGTGRQGVISLPISRGNIIRPLYDVTRKEIMAYLDRHRLAYMIDRSNLSPVYTRNRLRHRLIPTIEKEISERAIDNLIRFSDILAAEDKFLRQTMFPLYRRIVYVTPGGKFKLDLTRWFNYDKWLKRRLIMQWLSDAELWEIDYVEVERMINIAEGKNNIRRSLPGHWSVEKCGNEMFLYQSGNIIDKFEINIPGRIELPYPELCISTERAGRRSLHSIKKFAGRIAYVDAAKLSGEIFVSGVKKGMKFRPCGRPGSKKVGDFLTDIKYPRPLRDELPIICDQKGIVWLAGLEIDDRVKIDSHTKETVKFEIGRY